MPNEEMDEVIIDTPINEETEEVELEIEETPEPKDDEPKKPEETLEQKKARLMRQLEQVDKKLGVQPPKVEKKIEKTEKVESNLSMKDAMALMTNGITHDDDIEEATRIARIEGKPISEILKDPYVKGKLDARKEERTTAAATHTGSARRSSGKVSSEQLLNNARNGQAPESSDEIERLYDARKGIK